VRARTGERPIVRVEHRFKWLDVLGFVHPDSGQTAWQFASTVSHEVMRVALRTCAKTVGVGPTKRIVVVLDRAGEHVSPPGPGPRRAAADLPAPSSPELHPAEQLWPFSDEPPANQHCATRDAREEPLAQRGDRLQHPPDVIRSAAAFHWWPAA
jgi:hypothetical protein